MAYFRLFLATKKHRAKADWALFGEYAINAKLVLRDFDRDDDDDVEFDEDDEEEEDVDYGPWTEDDYWYDRKDFGKAVKRESSRGDDSSACFRALRPSALEAR